MRNPKKQAIRYEIGNEGLLPDEPENRREKARIGKPPGRHCEARVLARQCAMNRRCTAVKMLSGQWLGHDLGGDWCGGGAGAEHGGMGLLPAALLRCRQGVAWRGGGAWRGCAGVARDTMAWSKAAWWLGLRTAMMARVGALGHTARRYKMAPNGLEKETEKKS